MISRSKLSIILSKLKGFNDPKILLEQYEIDSEIAGTVLVHAQMRQKVSGHSVADLGCGTGILGIGALILGAKLVYFVDIDENSLNIAKSNLEYLKSESSLKEHIKGKAIFLCTDVADFDESVDLVVMNPPFGVKVRHQDRQFLAKAAKIANNTYSFHKSESKGFIRAFAKDHGFDLIETMDFAWPLKNTMKYHKSRMKRIKVSCFVLAKS